MTSLAVAFDILARDKATRTLDRVGDSAERTGKKVGGLGKKAGLFAAVAGAALVKFGADSVRAFGESEQSQAKLGLAFKKFPKLTDISIGALQDFNSELAKKVTYDDDALASGQAVLAGFNLTGKQIQNLTPLLADYAAKTGKDIPTAATDLGRAFLGNTKALKALGINYKSTGDLAKDQANIQTLLAQKVGGTAEAMGKTGAGKAKILQNQYGELQEKVGSKLVPVLLKLADVGLKVVDFIDRNSAVIGPLVAIVGTLVVGIKAWTIAQAALNAVMLLNPIGLVVLAVAALAAGLVVAYKKSETFRNIVQGAFKAIGTAARFMWDSVLKPVFKLWLNAWFTIIGAIVNGAAKAFGWVPGIGDKLKGAAKAFNKFRDEANAALDGIKAERTVVVRAKLTTSGTFATAVRDPDFRAKGGPVMAGRPYVVGEHTPELFVPKRSGTILNAQQLAALGAGGNTYEVTVNNPVPEKASESVPRALRNAAWLAGTA